MQDLLAADDQLDARPRRAARSRELSRRLRARRRAGSAAACPMSSGSMRTSVPGGHCSPRWAGRWSTPSAADHDVLGAVATLGADPAALHRDRARERLGDLGLVGHHDDGRPELVAEAVDELEHVVAVVVAELAGRLVGQQQLRRRGDRAGQREPLLLAARERPDHLVASGRASPTRSSRSVSSIAGRVSGRALATRAKARFCRAVAYGSRLRLAPWSIVLTRWARTLVSSRSLIREISCVAEEDPARRRPLDPAEQRQQRRLARTGRSEEGDPLAGAGCRGRRPAGRRRHGPRRCGRGGRHLDSGRLMPPDCRGGEPARDRRPAGRGRADRRPPRRLCRVPPLPCRPRHVPTQPTSRVSPTQAAQKSVAQSRRDPSGANGAVGVAACPDLRPARAAGRSDSWPPQRPSQRAASRRVGGGVRVEAARRPPAPASASRSA